MAFGRDACGAKFGLLQVLLSRNRDAWYHVAKRLNDDRVRLEAGRALTESKAEDEVRHFMRGLVIPMRACAGKYITLEQAFLNECSYMVLWILRSVEGEPQDIVSGQSVFADGSLDVSCVSPSCDRILLPWTDAAHDGTSLPARASNKLQAGSFISSEKTWKTPSKRSTKRRGTSATRARSDVAKASSDGMPVID